jgi:GTP-binding protein
MASPAGASSRWSKRTTRSAIPEWDRVTPQANPQDSPTSALTHPRGDSAVRSRKTMNPNESFIDEATISVRAGDGGDGCVSMRREKYVPRGGPNGGDGGRGGDVAITADRNLSTLYDQRMRRKVVAEPGRKGDVSNRTGRSGCNTVIRVPIGTIVYDLDPEAENEIVADLSRDGESVLLAHGGRGGRGNARFANASRQTPDFAESGQPGVLRKLRLSLKLLADIGLVGFPNAGKSTLLSRISQARPRVASYPFTTLTPSLGVVEIGDRRFVAADIPGLIEGASGGAGLGHRFLRHIERTRVIVHLLDAGSLVLESADLVERYETIRRELGSYSPDLLERPELVVLGKIDLVQDPSDLDPVDEELSGRGLRVLRLSSVTGTGVDALLNAMAQTLDQAIADEAAKAAEDGS